MELHKNLLPGAVGATVSTALHEGARHTLTGAPRVDLVAEEALAKAVRPLGLRPGRKQLYRSALVGDLVSNSLYYAVMLSGGRSFRRSLLWGSLAGLGAVLLPPVMGLKQQPRRHFVRRAFLTVAWYLTGALTARAASQFFTRKSLRAERFLPPLEHQPA